MCGYVDVQMRGCVDVWMYGCTDPLVLMLKEGTTTSKIK